MADLSRAITAEGLHVTDGPPQGARGGMVLTVGGAVVDLMPGWTIHLTQNGRGIFNFDVVSEDGTVRPGLDAVVSFAVNGETLFAGEISHLSEGGAFGGAGTPITTSCTASDRNAWPDRRFVFGVHYFGGVLKQWVEGLVPFVALGLDPSQAFGPTLGETTYHGIRGAAALDDLTLLSGWVWRINSSGLLRMFAPGSESCPFNIVSGATCLAIGDVRVEPDMTNYVNRVVVQGEGLELYGDAQDAAGIAEHNYREEYVLAVDLTTQGEVDTLAAAILASRLPILKKVFYTTHTPGAAPGLTQTITVAERHINNTFLIADVTIRGTEGGPEWDVTALEGLVYQRGWRETYRTWGGGATGATTVTGGGGAAGTAHSVYFLGGNGIEATESPTPTWVPASGGGAIGQGATQVRLDTVVLGSTTITVVARLRALDAGVSVQARLYDVTDGAPCSGLSAVVTNTAWETATWTVTLTAGSHFYELQILPGLANKPVMAVAYAEV